jgi:hypothetical protein
MLSLARGHDVITALAGGVEALGDPAWADLLPFVSAAARENAERNQLYLVSAHSVSRALTEAAIPHVFSKGLAFFFDDPASLLWRTISDIDLLVKEADVRRASAVIRSLGYRQARPGATYNPRLHHHAAPLKDDQTGIFYELHTRMMQAPRHNPFTFEELLASSRVIQSGGLDVRVPSPEHRMFNLIAHAQISNWDYPMRQISVRSLLDAAELAHRHAVDWHVMASLFERIRAKSELMGFLVAAGRLIELKTGLEGSADLAAQRWADQSIAALERPAPRMLTALRVAGQYARMIAQHPQRLEMIYHYLSRPERLSQLIETLRGRFAL